MVFNSIEFFIFFPVVTLLYFLLKHRLRWAWLLAASCFFYMFFKPVFILILFFTIVVDYYAGIYLERTASPARKKLLLVCSLIANIGILAVFKYFNFINENISLLLGNFGFHNPVPFLSIVLPIGLSFHTFQAMSYTIEVYRGNQKAEKHFGIYALYVMFYPQLVAGPIERPQNILPQLHKEHRFDAGNLVIGLRYILWGLFKKMVIADNIGVYVNKVFDHPSGQNSASCLIAAYLFAFQIYCDFSGYSDIAIGTAKTMGIDLMKNFNLPYISASISEFWSRWHVSLSTWFRDYLYIPLGGNRRGKLYRYRNLFLVFLISGLWHGANWTFIVWGALHGAFLLLGIILFEKNSHLDKIKSHPTHGKIYRAVSVVVTFHLVTLAWIYFRANSIATANLFIKTIFSGNPVRNLGMPETSLLLGVKEMREIFLVLLWVTFFFFIDSFKEKESARKIFRMHGWVRSVTYILLTFCVFFYGFIEKTPFIYFQF